MGRRAVLAAIWLIAALLLFAGGSLREALRLYDGMAVQAKPAASVAVQGKQTNYGNEYMIVDICIPAVSGFGSASFEQKLNEGISAQVAADKKEAEDDSKAYVQRMKARGYEPYTCVFYTEYEVKCAERLLSLRVTTFLDNGGTGMPHTVYYNADIQKSELLTLYDLFRSGSRFKKSIDRIINNAMLKDPERYDVPFKGIARDTQFFISGGALVIAFAKYEIASGMTGEPEFLIPAAAIAGMLKREYAGLIYRES